MEKITLSGENFTLRLSFEVAREDFALPVNTSLLVSLIGEDFSAETALDVDIKALSAFSYELCRLYETLSGHAEISEPYGAKSHLAFEGDGMGHIKVSGRLHSQKYIGNAFSLEFENHIDQTELRGFCVCLRKMCSAVLNL
ncbi:MAG: hypothetical protein LUD44_07750 [Firmicutes bacterium]|nr:hypothetical protein [Bacillota bacterium]